MKSNYYFLSPAGRIVTDVQWAPLRSPEGDLYLATDLLTGEDVDFYAEHLEPLNAMQVIAICARG